MNQEDEILRYLVARIISIIAKYDFPDAWSGFLERVWDGLWENEDFTPEQQRIAIDASLQTLIYSTGKENGYAENLRDWFKLIYEVVFGDENGPRMGFFISFFGVNETKELIKEKIK